MKHDPDLRISELKLILPPAPKPAGVYKPVLVVDKFLYVSGQGPINSDGTLMKGKVGADLDLSEGKLAARQVGLTMLSTIKTHFGELKKNKASCEGTGNGQLHIYLRSATRSDKWLQ
jgi:hypothetical protein